MKTTTRISFGYRWRWGLLFIIGAAVPVALGDAAIRFFSRYASSSDGVPWWALAGVLAALAFMFVFGPIVAYQQIHHWVADEAASNQNDPVA